ncbi:hypothetical protein D3C78_1819010 [compost metagenome]
MAVVVVATAAVAVIMVAAVAVMAVAIKATVMAQLAVMVERTAVRTANHLLAQAAQAHVQQNAKISIINT